MGKLLDYVDDTIRNPVVRRCFSEHLVCHNIAKALQQCGRADNTLIIQHGFEIIEAFNGRKALASTLCTVLAHPLGPLFAERTHGS